MIAYFVRHGQTDFNKASRLQGIAFDEPLNETGVKQMQQILPRLPQEFDIIYSAPAKRVLASAEIIANHFKKTIVVREELLERDFGNLAGKTWHDIPNGYSFKSIDEMQYYDYQPFGGESVQDVTTRLQKFLNDIEGQDCEAIIIVTSLGIIRLAYKLL